MWPTTDERVRVIGDDEGMEPDPSTQLHERHRAGRLARRFAVAGVAILVLASALTGAFGRRSAGGTVDDVMQFTGPLIGIALVASALAALGFATWALLHDRERTGGLWASFVFGILGVLFLLAELLLPH